MEHERIHTRFPIKCEIPVRFTDVDIYNLVNNARYFTFMEEARLAYFEKISDLKIVGQKSFPKGAVLSGASCRFISPTRLGEVVVSAVGVVKLDRFTFTMEYRMSEKNSGRPLARGSSVQVAFDFVQGKKIEISSSIVEEILGLEKSHVLASPTE